MIAPRVYLIARPAFDLETTLRFLDDEKVEWSRSTDATNAEELVELAGRVCYMSFGTEQSSRSNAAYVANLIGRGHESVLEHVGWTFLITGVSRAFSHQLVRHRPGFAFSQLSQQYHEEADACFVEPSMIRASPRVEAAWRKALSAAIESYREILSELASLQRIAQSEVGAKEALRAVRSAARSVLPNATETKIVVTANARAFRHFLKVRGAISGDEEMRRVSALLLGCLKNEAPSLFFDFVEQALPDGSPIVRSVSSVAVEPMQMERI